MNLNECYPGQSVIYRPHPGAQPEDGIVVRVGDPYVFVLYRGDLHSKATAPEQLERP